MCDLDVYNYLYKNDLQEYQAASKKALHVLYFIMVPLSRSNQVAMESGSPQAEDIAFDSDNNMSLRVPIKNSIPTWVDNSSPFHIDFPLKDGLYLGAQTKNAFPSYRSSLHIETTFWMLKYQLKKVQDTTLQFSSRVDEATKVVMKEMYLVQDLGKPLEVNQSLQSIAGNLQVMQLFMNISNRTTSTSNQPIACCGMEVENNDILLIPNGWSRSN